MSRSAGSRAMAPPSPGAARRFNPLPEGEAGDERPLPVEESGDERPPPGGEALLAVSDEDFKFVLEAAGLDGAVHAALLGRARAFPPPPARAWVLSWLHGTCAG